MEEEGVIVGAQPAEEAMARDEQAEALDAVLGVHQLLAKGRLDRLVVVLERDEVAPHHRADRDARQRDAQIDRHELAGQSWQRRGEAPQ